MKKQSRELFYGVGLITCLTLTSIAGLLVMNPLLLTSLIGVFTFLLLIITSTNNKHEVKA